ncbi:MAG TPA: DoxX family protein [Thermoanaerobaculia bacterium]
MNWTRVEEITYFVLRVVVGFLFFQVGTATLFGWFGGVPPEAGPPPALMSQIGIGKVMEVVGGLAILLGLFTRPVAFLLCGEMAVAYWQFHAPQGGWPFQNQGIAAVLFCFIFLYMVGRGGGEWSLDALLWGKRGNAANAAGRV